MNEHILDSDLDLVYTEIMAATHPRDVFGSPAKNLPLPEQQQALLRRFSELQQVTNPDQYTRIVDASAAADAQLVLNELYEQAKAALKGGAAIMDFTVNDRLYHLGERIAIGEHSMLHRAIATQNGISDEVVVKIAQHEAGSTVLRQEAAYLRQFHHAHQHNPIVRVQRTLPKLIDSFAVEDRQLTVLPFLHGHKNLKEIMEHFPAGLPVGHAAWIARRVLALPITASLAGLRHNRITPEHVLVHPVTHEPMYLGWGHATPSLDTPEATDTRETGKLIWQLFGNPGDETWNAGVPPEVISMIESLTNTAEGQTRDLSQFFTDFTETIYRTLGKRYRPLNLS